LRIVDTLHASSGGRREEIKSDGGSQRLVYGAKITKTAGKLQCVKTGVKA
jgi:hypothetical protein